MSNPPPATPTDSAGLPPPPDPSRRLIVRSSVVGAVCGSVPFLIVLWDVGVRPLRTANGRGVFSNFYDVQARAILSGHLDVPAGQLGIEEFVVRGRSYMYFPPFPSILRMPILAVTDSVDGKLTALSMLAAWIVLVVAVAALIWTVRRSVRGDESVTRFEAVTAALLLTSITGGSATVFIGSQPFVFHEVYLWSSALTISTVVLLLRTCEHPSGRRIVALGMLATMTISTRTPAGWAMALTIVAAGIWLRTSKPLEPARRIGRQFIAAGVATMFIGGSVNWAKFHHAFLFPIERQVWSNINPQRQLALAANDNRLDGLQFVWTTMTAYFRPDGIRLVPYFPFVTLPAEPVRAVGDVVLDQTYRTGSVTSFMPLLAIGGIWGLAVALSMRPGPGRVPLRLALAGCLAMTFGVMAFSHITFRYTADFIPLLAVGSAVASADIARRLVGRTPRTRVGAAVAIAGLTVYGIAANVAVGITEARLAARGPTLVEYLRLQRRLVIWPGAAPRFTRVEELPPHGAADELVAVGDCDALYLGVGSDFDSWVPVEQRGAVVHVTVSERDAGIAGVAGRVVLVTFGGVSDRHLELERSASGRFRFLVRDDRFVDAGRWSDAPEGTSFDVVISANTAVNAYELTSIGRLDTSQVLSEPDDNGHAMFVAMEPDAVDDRDAARIGIDVDTEPGPPLALCNDLLAARYRQS